MCHAQDAVVARQFLTDYATFQRTARMWTGKAAIADLLQTLCSTVGEPVSYTSSALVF
jgi:hypothetical protein